MSGDWEPTGRLQYVMRKTTEDVPGKPHLARFVTLKVLQQEFVEVPETLHIPVGGFKTEWRDVPVVEDSSEGERAMIEAIKEWCRRIDWTSAALIFWIAALGGLVGGFAGIWTLFWLSKVCA